MNKVGICRQALGAGIGQFGLEAGMDGCGPRELGGAGFPFPCVHKDEDSCKVRTTQRKDGEQTPLSLFVDTEPKVSPPWARPVLQ